MRVAAERRWNGQRTGCEPPPVLKLENTKITWIIVVGSFQRSVLREGGWGDLGRAKTTAREYVGKAQMKSAAYSLGSVRSDGSATMYRRR